MMNASPFQLVTHTLCPYVQRSIITLKEKGIAYTRTDIDLANKPDWFRAISPLGKVPVLVVNDARSLFESAVICEYLDEVTPGSLHPLEPLEKAYHRAWIEFGSSILAKIASLYNAKQAEEFGAIHDEIKEKFQAIEAELTDGPFFSGERFGLIDAVYGPIFRYFDVFDSFSSLATFADLSKCQAWREALRQRASVQAAVAANYPTLLKNFLLARHSYMSQLVQASN